MSDFNNGLTVSNGLNVDGTNVTTDTLGLTVAQLTAAGYAKLSDITKTQIGLPNVDNTSDVNKPVSTALSLYVGKEKEYLAGFNQVQHIGTIVDSCIDIPYTHNDSGAWTDRCTDKSWYNETIYGNWLGQRASENYARYILPNSAEGNNWLVVGSPTIVSGNCYQSDATTGRYLSVPSSATNNVTGDLDLIAKINLTDWTPSAFNFILNKTGTVTSYGLSINTIGRLIFQWGNGSALLTVSSTASPTVADGADLWVRATLDVDNGAGGYTCIFYTSLDGTIWSQLGTSTVTSAGTTTIATNTNALTISVTNLPLNGKIYYVEVKSGIGGTTVAKFDGSKITTSSTNDYFQNSTDGKFYALNATSGVTEVFRGNKREYPKAGVLWIAEAWRVIGYDFGTGAMWMVFIQGGGSYTMFLLGANATCICSVNGSLYIGMSLVAAPISYKGHIAEASFASDRMIKRHGSYNQTAISKYPLSYRNSTLAGFSYASAESGGATATWYSGGGPTNADIKDIDCTVLEGAPVDIATGLQMPTIVAATNGGVSVMKHDGSVVSLLGTGVYTISSFTKFDKNGRVRFILDGASPRYYRVNDIPSANITFSNEYSQLSSKALYTPVVNLGNMPYLGNASQTKFSAANDAVGTNNGLTFIKENILSPTKGMTAHITNLYNTGWMVGGIRLATLADTASETITSGPEVITGTWNASPAGVTVSGGTLTFTNASATTPDMAENTGVCIADVTYIFTFTVSNFTLGGGVSFMVAGASVGNVYTAGTFTQTIKPSVTGPIGVRARFSATSCTVGNISVRRVDLMTNGDFTTDTTGWGNAGGSGSLSAVSGAIRITNAIGINGRAQQTVATVIGKTYYARVDCVASSSATYELEIRGGVEKAIARSTPGVLDISFTAVNVSTPVEIYAIGATGATADFDNISVLPAEPDRSIRSKGFVLYGTLNKTPVAAGSSLVAYSGFSVNNYLEQPYNSDLDFGTGDFSIMGWVNLTSLSASVCLMQRTLSGNGGGLMVYLSAANLFYLYASTDTVNTVISGPAYTFAIGVPIFISIWRSSGVVYWSVNGVVIYSLAYAADISYPNAITRFGVSASNTSPLTGSMALWRLSGTAPSLDQIAQIYRDELPLFQPNAKCVLDGETPVINVVDYDKVDDVTHVGTATHRSSFKGLLRVSSEASSVGSITSISSYNGTIITCGTNAKIYKPDIIMRDELNNQTSPFVIIPKNYIPFEYVATASQTVIPVPKGFTIKRLSKNGLYIRENTGTPNWVRSNDGYVEYATLSSACTVGDLLTIECARV